MREGDIFYNDSSWLSCRYTEQSQAMLDFMFPSLGIKDGFDPEFPIEEFSSLGFWRHSVDSLETSEIDDFLKKQT